MFAVRWMRVYNIFVLKNYSHEINEFISKLIPSSNHQDDAKIVVDFNYGLESELFALFQQIILSFTRKIRKKKEHEK